MKKNILDNSKKSIRLGMQDFHNPDSDRVLSAVRNLYAGLLLLFKYTILDLASDGKDDTLIRARVLPIIDNDVLSWAGQGKTTIDVREIEARFNSLGLTDLGDIDWKALRRIQDIRNDVEHLYSVETVQVMKEVITSSLNLVTTICNDFLEIAPVDLLGENCWRDMLRVQQIYNQELQQARLSLEKLDWGSIPSKEVTQRLRCIKCGSALVCAHPEQNGVKPGSASYFCSECSDEPFSEEILLEALEKWDRDTHYKRETRGALDLRYLCYGCGNESYLMDYQECLLCDYELEYTECYRCDTPLSIEDQPLNGLCGYCDNVKQKMMYE